MGVQERLKLYDKYEEKRGCPLLTYVTSTRQGALAQMSLDVIPFFTKQLNNITNQNKCIDLLIASNGGDPMVSWRIISLLREKFKKVTVVVPYIAYSAATLLALGADKIIMHPYSNLGPIDNQLHIKKNNQKLSFPVEDLNHLISFVKDNVGITDQEQLGKVIEFLCNDAGSIQIGTASRVSQLAITLSEKLLSLHMNDKSAIKAISESLIRSFLHHGYPLGRREAKSIGLPVEFPDEELEGIIWNIWEDFEKDMVLNEPFNPVEIATRDEKIMNFLHNPKPNVILNKDYDLFLAALESKQLQNSFTISGIIYVTVTNELKVLAQANPIYGKWN